MNEISKLSLKLLAITAVAGLALGATNALTSGPIKEQEIAAANAARMAVLPAAVDFVSMQEEQTETITDVYQGVDASQGVVGYTAKTTVNGFGGPIEIIVGVDGEGVITGVNVGGSDFSETAGLGARTKEPAFAAQFSGKSAPLALRKNGGDIDAVTSATISSTAVVNGVSALAEALGAIAGR